MLPSRFEYHRPDSLEEALQLLSQYGDEAKVLAGGQSLIPVMKLRLATPAHLVDIGRLGLEAIAESDGRLTVGALARHRDLERSEVLKARYPVMAAAAPLISDPIVRNLGTIERAGIALTAVGPKNLRPTDAEASLAGAEPTEAAFAEAGRLAAEASSPVSDIRGSADYKRHVVDVYVRRGLARALEMARAA